MKFPGTPRESGEQAAVIDWVAQRIGRYPALAYLYAVPNGEKRDPVTAKRLVGQGVRPGVPDLVLPTARVLDGVPYHGLYLELKRDRTGRLSVVQRQFCAFLSSQGYCVRVAYGADDAITQLERYVGAPEWRT